MTPAPISKTACSNFTNITTTTKTTTNAAQTKNTITHQPHNYQLEKISVKNVHNCVIVDDFFYELFGLRFTAYLRDNCLIETDYCITSGEQFVSVNVTATGQVCEEI